MTLNHVMVDVETLSTHPDAAILSIGAYKFDPNVFEFPGKIADPLPSDLSFYANVADSTGHVDTETVHWWLAQYATKQTALLIPEPMTERQALLGLHEYLGRTPDVIAIWSHATFDVPILESAYRRHYLTVPWHYRSSRDVRTVIEDTYGAYVRVEEVEPGFPHNPYPHRADWDAWHQSLVVQRCRTTLNAALDALKRASTT